MRLPKIWKREADPSIKETIYNVDALPEVEYEPDVDFDDDKSVNSYIKEIKGMIRRSSEYTKLVKFLKEKCDCDACFFYPKVKKDRDGKVKIELHHTGFVIEDIIRIVLRKRYGEGECYDVLAVADEVMECHYKGMISFTALSATMHSLIHEDNSGLFVPLHMVDFGNSDLFYEEYKEYVPSDLKQKYEQYQILSSAINKIEDIIPDYLDRNYIYFKKEGVEIPDMNKILKIIDIDKLQ